MSSPKTVSLVLTGSVPSKKNSRVHTRAGVSIPSKSFYDWQKSAMWQVRTQTRERFFAPVAVDVTIIFGTKARADLDNRLTSVLDMLVEAVVLKDDKWQDIPQMTAKAAYRKGEPGALITITEVEPAL
jgi:Holliday junction resolvase RusA-like endonuclease